MEIVFPDEIPILKKMQKEIEKRIFDRRLFLCERALKLHFLYSANHPKKQTLDFAQSKLGAQIEKKLRILTLSHMHGVPTLPSLNMPFGHAKISNTKSQTQYS